MALEKRPSILIQKVRLIDPIRELDFFGDILLSDGRIVAAEPTIENGPDGGVVVDGTGMVACPGFIDLHAHLREPGYEYKETIASGSLAAAAVASPPSAPCLTPTHR